MSSLAKSDREERYKHLIQPIRDLAQNWDVDIAASLEDYLEDLEEITITLDGGASKVNFAEAALLIQGSTSVYSRKVEHVYQLVHRTIDFLTQQKHQKNAAASKNKNGDDDIDFSAGEEAAFLPLDDIVEGKNIDIPVDADLSHSYGRARSRRRSSVATNEISFHGVRLGGHGEDREGGRGGGGGMSGVCDGPDITRPPMFLMEQDYGNSFKMSTCAPQQESGTLLIEGSTLHDSGGLLNDSNIDGAARACDFWRGVGRDGEAGRDGGLKASAEAEGWAGAMDMSTGNGGGDEDSDGSGGDFGGPEDDFEDPRRDAPQGDPRTPDAAADASASMAGGRGLRSRAPKETADENEMPRNDRALTSPWTALDPHDPGTSQPRPLRKGRTHTLPPQLRRGRGSKKAHEDIYGGGGMDEQKDLGGSWVGHDGRLMSCVPLLGLAYKEFQYIANREKQRKAAQTRLARRRAHRVFMGRAELLPELIPSNSLAAGGGGATGMGAMAAFDGYGSDESSGSDGGGGGGGFGDYGDGDDDDDDGGHGPGGYGGYCDDGQSIGGGNGGGVDADADVAPISLEDAFRDKPQTYQDVCRSHIEAFMRGTEKYAHETQLSKRVGAWQEKLEPLMESQEKRQAFDIHAYGESVLSRVASLLTPAQRARASAAIKGANASGDANIEAKAAESSGISSASSGEDGRSNTDINAEDAEPDLPLVDFGVVVAGKERFDVCRLFLASLQLANNGNVRLFHGNNAAEQATTPFQIELLTLQNSDNMTGCFAPSASLASPSKSTSTSTSTAYCGPDNAPQNGAKNGAKKGAKKGAGSRAKGKPAGRKGGRGGVVGTTEMPGVIQATA